MKYVTFGNAGIVKAIALTVVASLFVVTVVAAQEQNLLPNGGFEIDADGNGIPDGWLGQPHNFSRETLEEVQAYIDSLPSHKELLKGTEVQAADGWPIAQRKVGEAWGNYVQTAEWYQRLRNEYLPQNSRFGQLPLPEGLALGTTTCVISNLQPHEQVVSEPIPVKPNTGYRLSYWFRMSGGSQTVMFQIIDADAPRNEAWPGGGTEARRQVISGISLGWAWVPHWWRYEIPFRTGPEETAIRLRLWIYFVGYEDHRRMWYDDFRLVEDDSVVVGEVGGPVNPEPQWPEETIKRGYAVAVRPCLPDTYPNYQPRLAELNRPVQIEIAPGEYGSKVLFIRALRNLEGPLLIGLKGPPQLVGPHGIFLPGRAHWHDGGESFVQFRVCQPHKLTRNFQQYEMRPTFLMPRGTETKRSPEQRFVAVDVPAGGSASVWITVHTPKGMPPGEYRGEIQVVAPDEEFIGYSDKPTDNPGTIVPLIVTVRDFKLLEPDVTYGMYRNNTPRPYHFSLPVDYPLDLYIDQRQHGMNSLGVGGGRIFAYEDEEGQQHLDFTQFDSAMERMMRAGFHRNFLFFFESMWMGSPPGPEAALTVLRHCQEKGYPEPLFYAHDEPGAMGRALVEEMERAYGPARRQGLRTVTSGLHWRTQGEAYDVWILNVSQVGGKDWQETLEAAAEQGAEVWAYDCSGYINSSFVNNRFYAGLWTWACGLKGNWIWEYQNKSFAPSDSTPPSDWGSLGFTFATPTGPAASLSWEGRREGITDYRYLHTLQELLTRAQQTGKLHRQVARARRFIGDLRTRIPIDCFCSGNRPETREKLWWNPAPNIAPEEYDEIREECARHIQALKKLLSRMASAKS